MHSLQTARKRWALLGLSTLAVSFWGCSEERQVKTEATTPAAPAGAAAPSAELSARATLPVPAEPPIHSGLKKTEPGDRPVVSNLNSEAYAPIADNPFVRVGEEPLSTFSIDVDTASYANVRRFLTQNQRPPKDAVRIEELLNYFTYDDPPPTGDEPFSVTIEVAGCPWNADHRLARIGLMGKPIANDKRPPSNLVFLIDVSGSMNHPEQAAALESRRFGCSSSSSARTTAWRSSSTPARRAWCSPRPPATARPRSSRRSSSCRPAARPTAARGSNWPTTRPSRTSSRTAPTASILATDGDFNVGVTNQDELIRLIEAKAKSGVFLSVLGFGMGNLKDRTLEKLADKGNGHYAYIDTLREADKVLVEELGSTPGDDRQGRQDPGRVQPGPGRGVSPDRLREPPAAQPGLQRRHQGRRRDRRGAPRHGPLRAGPRGPSRGVVAGRSTTLKFQKPADARSSRGRSR